jgi:hypothetical protein
VRRWAVNRKVLSSIPVRGAKFIQYENSLPSGWLTPGKPQSVRLRYWHTAELPEELPTEARLRRPAKSSSWGSASATNAALWAAR